MKASTLHDLSIASQYKLGKFDFMFVSVVQMSSQNEVCCPLPIDSEVKEDI